MKRTQIYKAPTIEQRMAKAIIRFAIPNFDPPAKPKKYNQKRRDLSTPEILRMAEEQGYKCPVCQFPFHGYKFHLDHDHRTNKTRALLCPSCNSLVGLIENGKPLAEKNQDLEERIRDYIAKYSV